VKEIKKVAIIGLGAIGSIYAVKLHAQKPESLRVIVDKPRSERYKKDGLIFNGQRYDFNYALPDKNAEKADLIIVATKSSGLADAVKNIEGYVGDNTVIIAPLNGITSEEVIAAAYGWDKVLYSLFIGHISTRRGREVSHDGVGTIVYGEADNSVISDKVAVVRDFFITTGIDHIIPEDMLAALWGKFMVNVGFNQTSAVLLAPYSVFHECDKATGVACKLMGEVVALAKKAGIKNTDKLIEASMDVVRAQPADAKSSMLQDVEAKNQTEVDMFAGTVCELGRKYGVETPYNTVFLDIIGAIDQRNSIRK